VQISQNPYKKPPRVAVVVKRMGLEVIQAVRRRLRVRHPRMVNLSSPGTGSMDCKSVVTWWRDWVREWDCWRRSVILAGEGCFIDDK
jgi:hypothetical protein